MTGSDEKMMAAVQARQPFVYNSREVRPEGNKVHVSLHGKPCACIDFGRGLVTVHGESLNSRKSAKVFNAVLRTYTESYAQSRDGRWEIVVPVGMEVEFTGDKVSIPILRAASP